MTFIEPSLKEIYNTLNNNDELITYLKENEYLLTRSMLYDSYTNEEIKSMEAAIAANNRETLYNVAQVLLDYSVSIKSSEIWVLSSNLIGFADMAAAFGLAAEDFSLDAYRLIVFTYKYCYLNSFFQNNIKTFLPESDYEFLQDNAALKGFVDAMMKEFDKFNGIISKCCEYQDFDKIPYDLINYLSQLLGFEKATINADDDMEYKYRELVKNIIDIYRIKGTNYSFELLFKFLGYNIEINEFYFDRRMYYSSGNSVTSSTDKTNYLLYMSTENPADNNLDTTENEYVSLGDFTTQYNLTEFNELVKEYGVEAVLGYSPLDSNGDEYTGKVYKYFKTNLVYYTISIEGSNPTDKQLSQINKILTFITPAYIMRTTNVNIFTGDTDTIPSDNMIFFDDNRTLGNTLLELEEGVTTEEGYEAIRETVRTNYAIMLDSEKRDDKLIPDVTNKDLYLDDSGNILHDDTSSSEYINTIGTTTFKPKIPMSFTGNISLNKYAPCSFFDFISIREDIKNNNLYTDVEVIDNVNDFVNSNLGYSRSLIQTLTLIKTFTADALETIRNGFNICYESEYSSFPNFINPIKLGKDALINLVSTEFVILKNGDNYALYKYGDIPSYNSSYDLSFKINLIKTQRLYRSINKKVSINVDSSLKIEKPTLSALYDAANEKTPSDALKYYYFNSSENYWYYPLRKAELTTFIISSGKTKKYLKINNNVLPLGSDETINLAIPIIFSSNEKYGATPTSIVYNSVEDCFKANNVDYYNNFLFYIEDQDDDYNSDLYKFSITSGTKYLYSKENNALYLLKNNKVEKLNNFFGKLIVEDTSAKLYEFDEVWKGYSEEDDFNNFIFYNHPHRVVWNYIGFDKIIGRPIKAATDLEVDENLEDAIINECFYSTFNFLSKTDKNEILKLGNFNLSGELLAAIKDGKNLAEIISYITTKVQEKDIYGNYNDNFKLLLELISTDDLLEFCKDYYYNKLTKLYREAFIEEASAGNEVDFTIEDSDREPLYETLNGNMGTFGQPNTLLQSYYGNSSLDIPFTVSDNTLIILNEDLVKYGLINKGNLVDIANFTINYGILSLFTNEFSYSLNDDSNLEIRCYIPDDIVSGTLSINLTPQYLSDNKITEKTSELYEDEQFVTNGDDRVLDVNSNLKIDAEVISYDDNLFVLVDEEFCDLYDITLEFDLPKKMIQFDKIESYASVNSEGFENGAFAKTDFIDIKNNFSVNIEKLRIVEK